MRQIRIATVRREADVQIIPVNASLVVKTVNALNALEPALFAVESVNPKFKDIFKRDVCDFIKELYDALLEDETE